nr:MAG TPA: hypothetical protein [Caudoviricetes sp.]
MEINVDNSLSIILTSFLFSYYNILSTNYQH